MLIEDLDRQMDEVARSIAEAIWVGLPGGVQGTLPGLFWPELRSTGGSAPVSVIRVERGVANELLVEWDHPLGPCTRPFGREYFVLVVSGEPVALASSVSTVSAPVYQQYTRRNVVELGRLARSPRHPHALRAMLRLWREYLAPMWAYWPVEAAVSYALPGTTGDLYRFDGWKKVRECRPWAGGGTRARPPRKIEGVKSLWIYEYPR